MFRYVLHRQVEVMYWGGRPSDKGKYGQRKDEELVWFWERGKMIHER